MVKFLLLLLLLLVFCWPLALLVLVLYPLIWLLLLPFRLLDFAVEGVFELLRAILLLPARVLGGGPRRPQSRAGVGSRDDTAAVRSDRYRGSSCFARSLSSARFWPAC